MEEKYTYKMFIKMSFKYAHQSPRKKNLFKKLDDPLSTITKTQLALPDGVKQLSFESILKPIASLDF